MIRFRLISVIVVVFVFLTACVANQEPVTVVPIIITDTPSVSLTETPEQTDTTISMPYPGTPFCADVTEIPQLECEVLVTLANQMDDTSPMPPNPCDWSFAQCKEQHVTSLDLSGNELSSLPVEIGELSNLAYLNLEDNNLKQLPPEIGNLTNLNKLYLVENDIEIIPPEIGNLINLTALSMDTDKYTSLPSEISNLPNLTELKLSESNLDGMLPGVLNLSALTHLSLTGRITQLPPEIDSLTNLTTLWLYHSELSSLPPEIGNLTNLTRLDISHNSELSTLPPEIGNLTNLEMLNLQDNNLSDLPLEIINLTNLWFLDVSGNNLPERLPEICKGLSIETLDPNFCAGVAGTKLPDTAIKEPLVDIIGQSVNGNEITVTKLGSGETAVLLIGGLHAGFAPATVSLAEEIVDYYSENNQELPADVTLYVVTNANPDSVIGEVGEVNGRLNGNSVDLNRNWDCQWTADAQWRDQAVSGGSEPFSEPESQALRDLILEIAPESVVVFEAVGGVVVPGVCDDYSASEALAAVYAEAADYKISGINGSIITGDLTDWLNSQGIPAIAPLLSDYADTDWEQNLAGIGAILDVAVSSETMLANNNPTPTVLPESAPTLSQEFPGTITVDLNNGSNLGLPYLEISSETQTGNVSKIEHYPAVTGAEHHWAEITPAYIEITLSGDMLTTIHVYPLPENLDTLPDSYPDRVRRLQTLLTERPDLATKPGVPSMSNLGSLIFAQEQYVSFSDSIGVRFVVYGGSHATFRITNDNLLYKFTGITNDGRYVIGVDVSLDQADLPASGDGTGGYEDTYPDVVAQLNAAPNHSFTPDLALIDEMVSSIRFVPNPTQSTVVAIGMLGQTPSQDYETLVTLYRELDGEHWENNFSWLQTDDYCIWDRIRCTEDGRVRRLDLSGLGINHLPPEIGNLTDLHMLILARNNLSSVPPEIENLSGLSYLYLRDNDLSSFPPEIGNLSNLVELDVSGNNISSIPAEIGNMDNLSILALEDNALSALPPEIAEIGNPDQHLSIYLGGNDFSSLPAELCDAFPETVRLFPESLCSP